MTEELSPFLFPIEIVVNEIQIPIGLSLRFRYLVEPIIFDFNKSLRNAKAKIESISFSLVGKPQRFIDINVMINLRFSNFAEDTNKMIKENASLAQIKLLEHKISLTAKRDLDLLDALIDRLKRAPDGIFFTEIQQADFLGVGSLLGKTTNK